MILTSIELARQIAHQKNTNTLPPRFREASFRRFEPVIDEICKNFPEATSLRPAELSCETYVCRLRDAITVYVNSEGWMEAADEFKNISRQKLRDIFEPINGTKGFTIRHNGQFVTCGPPTKQKNWASGGFLAAPTTIQAAIDAPVPESARTIFFSQPPTEPELHHIISFFLRQGDSFPSISFTAPDYEPPPPSEIPGDLQIKIENNKWTIF